MELIARLFPGLLALGILAAVVCGFLAAIIMLLQNAREGQARLERVASIKAGDCAQLRTGEIVWVKAINEERARVQTIAFGKKKFKRQWVTSRDMLVDRIEPLQATSYTAADDPTDPVGKKDSPSFDPAEESPDPSPFNPEDEAPVFQDSEDFGEPHPEELAELFSSPPHPPPPPPPAEESPESPPFNPEDEAPVFQDSEDSGEPHPEELAELYSSPPHPPLPLPAGEDVPSCDVEGLSIHEVDALFDSPSHADPSQDLSSAPPSDRPTPEDILGEDQMVGMQFKLMKHLRAGNVARVLAYVLEIWHCHPNLAEAPIDQDLLKQATDLLAAEGYSLQDLPDQGQRAVAPNGLRFKRGQLSL